MAGWLVIHEKIAVSQFMQERISDRPEPLLEIDRPVQNTSYREQEEVSAQTDLPEEEVLVGVVSPEVNIVNSLEIDPEPTITPDPTIETAIEIEPILKPEPEPTLTEVVPAPDKHAMPDIIAESQEEATSHSIEPVRLSIVFDFDSASLSQIARERLDDAARQFLETGSGQLSVTGFADGSGDRAYNLELSRRRAKAVSEYLAASGVDASALKVEGLGIYNEAAPYDVTLTEVDYSNGRIVQVEMYIESGPSEQ